MCDRTWTLPELGGGVGFSSYMVLRLVLLAALLLSGFSSDQQSLSSAAIPSVDMAAAAALAREGRAAPYFLCIGSVEPSVAAYTPFIRVALALQTARHRGLQLSELPAGITAPYVHFVFRWPCETSRCVFSEEVLSDDMTPVVGLTSIGASRYTNYQKPAFVTSDLRLLDQLGGPPFARSVLMAAYPLDAIRPDIEVAAWWQQGRVFMISGGRITREELASWR